MRTLLVIAMVVLLVRNLLAATPATTQSTNHFQPGQPWLDDDGHFINCHGGGIIFHDGVYFWFGEHKIRRRGQGHDGACMPSTSNWFWSLGLDWDLGLGHRDFAWFPLTRKHHKALWSSQALQPQQSRPNSSRLPPTHGS